MDKEIKRIPSCMGLDEDNKIYLKERGGSAAEFVNDLIRLYRDSELVRDEQERREKRKPKVERTVALEELIKKSKAEKAETEIKIRAYLLDHPYIIYEVRTNKVPTSPELRKLKDRMSWSKYKIKTDCETIQAIIMEEVDKMDAKAIRKYEIDTHMPRDKWYIEESSGGLQEESIR